MEISDIIYPLLFVNGSEVTDSLSTALNCYRHGSKVERNPCVREEIEEKGLSYLFKTIPRNMLIFSGVFLALRGLDYLIGIDTSTFNLGNIWAYGSGILKYACTFAHLVESTGLKMNPFDDDFNF